MPPKFAKAGFTLAEVLITLGIIGIVAAMTIPNLMTSYQKKKTVNQLKAAQATLANAVKLAELENGELAGWDLADNEIEMFEKYLAPHLKASKRDIEPNTLKYYSPGGQRELWLAIIRTKSAAFTLLNGMEFILTDGTITSLGPGYSGPRSISMIVDLNGYNSLPNRFGRDTFFLELLPEKGVYQHNFDDGEYGTVYRSREQLLNGPSVHNYQCNKSGRGMWCGALIQRDGWTISKDYPW